VRTSTSTSGSKGRTPDVVEQAQGVAALGQVAQHDDVGRHGFGDRVGGVERVGGRRVVAVGAQLIGQECGGALVGVDEQDGVRHAEPSLKGS
jgi:hypothetical protein